MTPGPASPTFACPHCNRPVRLRRRAAEVSHGLSREPSHEVSHLTGPDGPAAGGLLDLIRGHAGRAFREAVTPAVERLVGGGDIESAISLLTPAETAELAEWFAAALGTAELLGRARVRLRVAEAAGGQYAEAPAVPRTSFAALARVTPSDPQSALEYFTALVPEFAGRLGRFVERVTRRAFRLAVEAGETLLAKVKEMFVAADRDAVPPPDVPESLDRLGVTAGNPTYSDLVAGVTFTSAYHDGGSRELARVDAADVLPGWRYTAQIRPTSRPHHAERNDWLYPATTFFTEIRGTDISETAGCLCSFTPLSAGELQAALAAGARWAPGYEGGR